MKIAASVTTPTPALNRLFPETRAILRVVSPPAVPPPLPRSEVIVVPAVLDRVDRFRRVIDPADDPRTGRGEKLQRRVQQLGLFPAEVVSCLGVDPVVYNRWIQERETAPEGVLCSLFWGRDKGEAVSLLRALYEGDLSGDFEGRDSYWRALRGVKYSGLNPHWAKTVAIHRFFNLSFYFGYRDAPRQTPDRTRRRQGVEFDRLVRRFSLSGHEIAAALDVDDSTISTWRHGKRAMPESLLSSLRTARGTEHARFLLYDFYERRVESYRARYPYCQQVMELDRLLKAHRGTLAWLHLGTSALRGGLDLSDGLNLLRPCRTRREVRQAIEKIENASTCLTLYRDSPLSLGLRRLVSRLGLSHRELAENLGVHSATSNRWLSGYQPVKRRAEPTVRAAIRAQSRVDLLNRVARVGKVPTIKRTPNRPMSPRESRLANEILETYRPLITRLVHWRVSRYRLARGADDAELWQEVAKQISLAVMRKKLKRGEDCRPWIQRVVCVEAIKLIRQRLGLNTHTAKRLRDMAAVEKQLLRTPTVEDLVRDFRLTPASAQAHLDEYRSWEQRRRQVPYHDEILEHNPQADKEEGSATQ